MSETGLPLCGILAIALSFVILPLSAVTATSAAIFEPSLPVLKSIDSQSVTPKVGQQVLIVTNVKNNADKGMEFLAIVEVRNSNGITESLAWQQGHTGPGGHAEVGVSWIPKEEETYQLRAFVLSGLKNPVTYSPVVSSDIRVAR